jgi:hypothetical protein
VSISNGGNRLTPRGFYTNQMSGKHNDPEAIALRIYLGCDRMTCGAEWSKREDLDLHKDKILFRLSDSSHRLARGKDLQPLNIILMDAESWCVGDCMVIARLSANALIRGYCQVPS